MNQILSVENKKNNGKKTKKASIHSIVVIFCIFLIIFGIGLVGTGAYSAYKISSNNDNNKNTTNAKTEPVITIERVNADTVNIVVTHDKGIQSVKYKINNKEEVELKAEKKLDFSKEITLPSGNVELTVLAEDVNGTTSTKIGSYEVATGPKITLEQIEEEIQATITSTINIDYIRYYWDNDEENATKYSCNDIKYVTQIEVKEGTHTLFIEAVDIEGHVANKIQKVIGDTKPEIEVTTDGENFIIKATDDESLSKIEIKLNSNDIITEEINQKEYTKYVKLEEGVNKIAIRVYNKNGIYSIEKIKYTKE